MSKKMQKFGFLVKLCYGGGGGGSSMTESFFSYIT